MTRLLILTLSLCSIGATADRPTRVLCFGDSITAGSALPKDEKPFAWPTLVEDSSAGKLRVINEGKGGRPTASVDEFRKALATHAPGGVDVVVIALGTNDSRDVSDACVPKAVANVRKMIDHARETLGPNARVLIVGPPNLNKEALGPTKPVGPQREQKLRDLGAAFEVLARDTKCDFVPLYGVVPPESLTRDGVHPDKAGNEAIAATVGKTLAAIAGKQ